MSGYTIPANAAEQTRQLVDSGIAERLLAEVTKRPGYQNTTVADCRFWARLLTDYPGICKPQLQVVSD